MGAVDLVEWTCVLCGYCIQNEQVEQKLCIRFCIKLEHSSTETIWMIQKDSAMGTWWLEASSWQRNCSCIMSYAEFFGETSNHPGDSAPLQPRFGALKLLAFPKTKITFQREEISDHQWDSRKYEGQLMTIGRTVWGPKVPTLKGTEVSLSCVQCFLYIVLSSINVSIFHITWLIPSGPVSYTHLTLPTTGSLCRSRWSPYH